MSVRDFDLRTSLNAESEGAFTKGGSTGCKPNQTIDKSADAVSFLKTQRKLQKKKKKKNETAASNSIHAQLVQNKISRYFGSIWARTRDSSLSTGHPTTSTNAKIIGVKDQWGQ
jgi:hypothetical protein